MSYITIVEGETPSDTLRCWFESYHPEYPSHQLGFWEETVRRDQCNPFTSLYNVVYFIDAEHNSYIIMHMEIYDEWEPKHFPLPKPVSVQVSVDFSWSPAPPEPNMAVCDMWQLKERVDWIFKGGTIAPLFDDPVLEWTTRFIVGMVPYEDRKWTDARLDVEQTAFQLRRPPSKRIEPTVADYIHYHGRFPMETRAPKEWFEVDASELSSDIMCSLPLYPNYKLHITWKECINYQWNKYLAREREVKTRIWTHKGKQNDELITLAEYIQSHKEKIKTRIKQERVKKNIEAVDVDIEDLQKVLPPCLKSVADVRRGRFPQDAERMYLVRSMRVGGIAFETTEKLLVTLHELYPNHQTVKGRFSYKYHWDKEYGAPSCATMCSWCPYKGAEDQRKMACHKEFQKEHPDKVMRYDANKFRGPFSFIQWNLRKSSPK